MMILQMTTDARENAIEYYLEHANVGISIEW